MEAGEALAALAPLSTAAVVLDFDGTLAPIVGRPEDAEPLPGVVEVLTDLVGRCAVLALVTGRPSEEVRGRIPVPGLRIEGLYGLERSAGVAVGPLPTEVVARVRDVAAKVPDVRVEEKGASVAVHVRGTRDPQGALATLRAPLARLAGELGLEIAPGKLVLELVPRGRPRKGAAVERLVRGHGVRSAMYAGDDEADLEAFAALGSLRGEGLRVVRIAVRGDETPAGLTEAADLALDGPAALLSFLRELGGIGPSLP